MFLSIYTIEMLLKIIGMGFILNKGAYLRDYWNILDFVIVITSYYPLILTDVFIFIIYPNYNFRVLLI